jgi:hypothetical protein
MRDRLPRFRSIFSRIADWKAGEELSLSDISRRVRLDDQSSATVVSEGEQFSGLVEERVQEDALSIAVLSQLKGRLYRVIRASD